MFNRAIALTAITLLAANSSAIAQRRTEPVRSVLEMRQEAVAIQEWDLSCGAAALTTILRYQFAEDVTEREIAIELMQRPEYVENPHLVQQRQGFSLLDLKRVADRRGYNGVGLGRLILDDLIENAPLITVIRTNGYNHFVVFRGLSQNRVLLADPAWGNRTMTIDKFEQQWVDYGESMGRVGFVVMRDGEVAPPNRLALKSEEFFTFN